MVKDSERRSPPDDADKPTGGPKPEKGSAAGDHPAGPHATPELTGDEATPGAGTLPGSDAEGDADAGTG